MFPRSCLLSDSTACLSHHWVLHEHFRFQEHLLVSECFQSGLCLLHVIMPKIMLTNITAFFMDFYCVWLRLFEYNGHMETWLFPVDDFFSFVPSMTRSFFLNFIAPSSGAFVTTRFGRSDFIFFWLENIMPWDDAEEWVGSVNLTNDLQGPRWSTEHARRGGLVRHD